MEKEFEIERSSGGIEAVKDIPDIQSLDVERLSGGSVDSPGAGSGSDIQGFEPGVEASRDLSPKPDNYVGFGEVTPGDVMDEVIERDNDMISRQRMETANAPAPVGTVDVIRDAHARPEDFRPKTEAEKTKEDSDARIRARINQLREQQAELKKEQERIIASRKAREVSDADRIKGLTGKISEEYKKAS